jgi:hypothetical protein
LLAERATWQRSWSELKGRYPLESVSGRLAYETKVAERERIVAQPNQVSAAPVLPEATLARLNDQERYQRWSWIRRSDSLRVVHGTYVEQFITSPGFGVTRMPLPSPYSIEIGETRRNALHKLDERPDTDGSPEPDRAPRSDDEDSPPPTSSFSGLLGELHRQSRQEFLDPDTFGYVRDRDHVAGFLPHGFSDRLPPLRPETPPGRWLTVRVELVSMLKHERPMAYVSEHLPNMTELRDAPVRELNRFERRAFGSLIEGEDLVSEAEVDRIRALGSLRATRQCVDCHRVERGTLLGAFSYEFLRDPPALRLPKSNQDADGKLL